jgi:DNA invertase Pin-like site-specific DNA recombinase
MSRTRRTNAPAPRAPHAVIYARTSTGEQTLGLAAQVELCHAHAARLGLPVELVVEEQVSGSVPPLERAHFPRALAALGEGGVLLMWRRDRLGRSVAANTATELIVRRAGARVVTGELGEEDTAENALMAVMLDGMAQYERALIITRTRAALAAKRARGEALGNTPRGTRRGENGMIETNGTEARAIERARALRAQGRTLAAVREELVVQGHTARGGRIPSLATLSRWCVGVELPEAPAPAPEAPAPAPEAHAPEAPAPAKRGRRPLTARPEGRGLEGTCLDLAALGHSTREIAATLAARGFVTSKGTPISHVQVHRVLTRARAAV